MPTFKLTRKTISALAPEAKPVTYWDSELKGFGLMLRPTGSRSWIIEYRPGAGGREVAKKRIVIGDPAIMTPEEARKTARDILAQIRLGSDPAADRAEQRSAQSFAELTRRWLSEHVEPKRKASTAAFYRNMLEVHILPALGNRQTASISRQDIARLHAAVGIKSFQPKRVGAKRTPAKKPRGGRVAANRVLVTVKAIFGWALSLGLLPAGADNPAKGVEPFREEGRERYLTDAEMLRLGDVLRLAETSGLPWEPDPELPEERRKHLPKEANRRVILDPQVTAAIRLLQLTGMRLREVLHLEWSQVDWQRGFLVLPDSKTGRKTVILGAAALAVLDGIPRLGRYVIASTTAGAPDEKPRADLHRPWRAIRAAAGLHDLRIHDLRHSNAAIGASSGLSLHQIGGLLGHRQASMTQRYAHLATDPQRRAADLIGDQVAAALGLTAAAHHTAEGDPRDQDIA